MSYVWTHTTAQEFHFQRIRMESWGPGRDRVWLKQKIRKRGKKPAAAISKLRTEPANATARKLTLKSNMTVTVLQDDNEQCKVKCAQLKLGNRLRSCSVKEYKVNIVRVVFPVTS
jgi:hypothetical protein